MINQFKANRAIAFEWQEEVGETADFSDADVAIRLASGYGLTPICHAFTSVTQRSYDGKTIVNVRFFVGIDDGAIVSVDMHPPVELVHILHDEQLYLFLTNPTAV